MKLKDALIGLLTWFGILGFYLIVMSVDHWGIWSLFILAVIVWAFYILVIIRDREREKRKLKNPVLWMDVIGPDGVKRWTAMDGSGRTLPENPNKQEEDSQ